MRRGSPGIRLALGHGDISGRRHEAGELAVGDFRPVHPEPVHGHLVHGAGVMHRTVIGTHPEAPARDPDHALGGRFGSSHLDGLRHDDRAGIRTSRGWERERLAGCNPRSATVATQQAIQSRARGPARRGTRPTRAIPAFEGVFLCMGSIPSGHADDRSLPPRNAALNMDKRRVTCKPITGRRRLDESSRPAHRPCCGCPRPRPPGDRDPRSRGRRRTRIPWRRHPA